MFYAFFFLSDNFVHFVKEQSITLNNNLNLWNCRYTPAKVCDYNPHNQRNPKKYKQIRYRLKSSIDTNYIFPENLILKIGNVLEILNLHQWINQIPKRGEIWQWKELRSFRFSFVIIASVNLVGKRYFFLT